MKNQLAFIGALVAIGVLQGPSLSAQTITVSASPLWTDTGISVGAGQVVKITASGSWAVGPEYGIPYTGPEGLTLAGWTDGFLAGANCGALLAYVGSDPFQGQWGSTSFFPQSSGYLVVGSTVEFTVPTSGELWLGMNDDAQTKLTFDNYGSMTANVTVVPEPTSAALFLLAGSLFLRRALVKR